MYISHMLGAKTLAQIDPIFWWQMSACFKFRDDRFRGLERLRVQFCHFPLTSMVVWVC